MDSPDVLKHVRYGNRFCQSREYCVEVEEYARIQPFLRGLAGSLSAKDGRVMLSTKSNYALVDAVPEEWRAIATSPLLLPKARKNPVEIARLKECHARDDAVLIRFLAMLEEDIERKGVTTWDEVSAAGHLSDMRSQQKNFHGLSFPAISAYGPNGAVIHYRPTPATSRQIATDNLYLLDSGGQVGFALRYWISTKVCMRGLLRGGGVKENFPFPISN